MPGIGKRIHRLLRAKLRRFRVSAEPPEPAPPAGEDREWASDPRKRDLAILEVPAGASPVEIKHAYRRLCQRYHPDRFGGDPAKAKDANALLVEINRAYEALRKSETRS